jgi:hypothetical protein
MVRIKKLQDLLPLPYAPLPEELSGKFSRGLRIRHIGFDEGD